MDDLPRGVVFSPHDLRALLALVNAEADTASHAAVAEVAAVTTQLAEAMTELEHLYRAIEDGGLDLFVLAPRIRDVKARVDELAARRALLATASTPLVRLADEATIARYVERLRAVLATGAPAAQRTFLRAWTPRIEADGMKRTGTFSLPGEPGGGAANTGSLEGEQDFLRPVLNVEPNRKISELVP
jgi:hypothetical protein